MIRLSLAKGVQFVTKWFTASLDIEDGKECDDSLLYSCKTVYAPAAFAMKNGDIWAMKVAGAFNINWIMLHTVSIG